ncbi:uncharacterized protein METZ01_LOCUS441107, partial [marine metagenome]
VITSMKLVAPTGTTWVKVLRLRFNPTCNLSPLARMAYMVEPTRTGTFAPPLPA